MSNKRTYCRVIQKRMENISILLQLLVGLLIFPLAAVPIGVVVAFLYIFYPTKLIDGFIK